MADNPTDYPLPQPNLELEDDLNLRKFMHSLEPSAQLECSVVKLKVRRQEEQPGTIDWSRLSTGLRLLGWSWFFHNLLLISCIVVVAAMKDATDSLSFLWSVNIVLAADILVYALVILGLALCARASEPERIERRLMYRVICQSVLTMCFGIIGAFFYAILSWVAAWMFVGSVSSLLNYTLEIATRVEPVQLYEKARRLTSLQRRVLFVAWITAIIVCTVAFPYGAAPIFSLVSLSLFLLSEFSISMRLFPLFLALEKAFSQKSEVIKRMTDTPHSGPWDSSSSPDVA
jgi:hypothetical protein